MDNERSDGGRRGLKGGQFGGGFGGAFVGLVLEGGVFLGDIASRVGFLSSR